MQEANSKEFLEADTNGDGKLSREEFKDFYNKMLLQT